MKYKLISVFITTFFISSMTSFSHALDLDITVEDEIRKNYNPNKLINDVGLQNSALNKTLQSKSKNLDTTLPALPNITKQKISTPNPSDILLNTSIPSSISISKSGYIKIKKGVSFEVLNNSAISDWQNKGTTIKFTSKKNVYGKNYSIPANTTFYGEIIESHRPQITCNGGLVVIRIYSMIYKGQTIPINACVTKANGHKIFLNNIKGDRTFIKTMWKKGDWGRTLFNKMLNLTINLGGEGSTVILSPFPITYGTICLGINTITSPICAFFSKGGHVSIPAGSSFKIKLTEDAIIN